MKDFDMDFDVVFEADAEAGPNWTEKYRTLTNALVQRSMFTDPEFASTVHGLDSNDLARCILQATLEGSEALARQLFELRGPVSIVYEKGRDEYDIATVNGAEFAFSRFDKLKGIEHVPQLKSLYKMIKEFGMKGIIEPGDTFPLLCQDRIGFFNEGPSVTFKGELPFLDAGVLNMPELAIAMLDESHVSAMPAAYQPVLCWATPTMVKEFPVQLAPLTPFQDVVGHGSLAEWKNMTDDDWQMEFQSIVTGVRPSEQSTKIAGAVFSYMGPESTKLGFDDERGRVLCETTVNFLLSFETGPLEQDNVTAAKEFVDNYFPPEIISAQVTQECVDRFGHDVALREFSILMQQNHSGGFHDLFGLLAKDHPLRDRAMSMMPREMWHKLALKNDGCQLIPASLVALYDAFGIDNTGMELTLYCGRIKDFLGKDFRFSDMTEVLEDSGEDEDYPGGSDGYSQDESEEDVLDDEQEELQKPTTVLLSYESTDFVTTIGVSNDELHRQMLNGYKEMLKLNLWPATSLRPSDIGQALSMSNREGLGGSANKLVMSLKAYLMLAGVEACVKAATSPQHWKTLEIVFSSDELTPYLSQMPQSARGRLLENVMGL
jgi:hypothetical protein